MNQLSVIGLDLGENRVGGADSGGFQGQFNLLANTRSEHSGAYLSELAKAFNRLLDNRAYQAVAVERAEYGINATSFVLADRRARMIGVVAMIASQRGVELIELSPQEVSAMATGRKTATKEEYLSAAIANGQKMKSEYVAHAYWVMCLAAKKLTN